MLVFNTEIFLGGAEKPVKFLVVILKV